MHGSLRGPAMKPRDAETAAAASTTSPVMRTRLAPRMAGRTPLIESAAVTAPR